MAVADFGENAFDFSFRVVFRVYYFQSVVGYLCSFAGKVVVAAFESVQKMVEVFDGSIRGFFQTRHVLIKRFGVLDRHGFVWTERGQNPYFKAVFGDGLVVLQ